MTAWNKQYVVHFLLELNNPKVKQNAVYLLVHQKSVSISFSICVLYILIVEGISTDLNQPFKCIKNIFPRFCNEKM